VVVLVLTGHGDVYLVLIGVFDDVYTHVILAVLAEDLVDVLVCELAVRKELACGVGVPFEESNDSVDYCVLFHDD
jgi:hypothetical protein